MHLFKKKKKMYLPWFTVSVVGGTLILTTYALAFLSPRKSYLLVGWKGTKLVLWGISAILALISTHHKRLGLEKWVLRDLTHIQDTHKPNLFYLDTC